MMVFQCINYKKDRTMIEIGILVFIALMLVAIRLRLEDTYKYQKANYEQLQMIETHLFDMKYHTQNLQRL